MVDPTIFKVSKIQRCAGFVHPQYPKKEKQTTKKKTVFVFPCGPVLHHVACVVPYLKQDMIEGFPKHFAKKNGCTRPTKTHMDMKHPDPSGSATLGKLPVAPDGSPLNRDLYRIWIPQKFPSSLPPHHNG